MMSMLGGGAHCYFHLRYFTDVNAHGVQHIHAFMQKRHLYMCKTRTPPKLAQWH